jgi:predicted HTH domain antitoxin
VSEVYGFIEAPESNKKIDISLSQYKSDSRGRAVEIIGLQPLDCRGRGFEFR